MRKQFTVILVAALLLSLAGCGSGQTASQPKTAPVLQHTYVETSTYGDWVCDVYADNTVTLRDYIGDTAAQSISIPSELGGRAVTSIAAAEEEGKLVSPFGKCPLLTSVEVPGSVRIIGESAFDGCAQLRSVVLGEGVQAISSLAFHDCQRLISVSLPGSLTVIGNGAFSFCLALTELTIPDGVQTIGDSALFQSGIRQIDLPASVRSIGSYAFAQCSSLSAVTLGESLQTIGERAFFGTPIVTLTIPDSVTEIGSKAFSLCNSLTVVGSRGSVTEAYCEANNVAFRWAE